MNDLKPILLLALFLTGCATTQTQNKVNTIVEDKFKNAVVYPTNGDDLPCQDFPIFKGKTMGDLYDFIALDISYAYQDCADKLKVNQKFINSLKK